MLERIIDDYGYDIDLRLLIFMCILAKVLFQDIDSQNVTLLFGLSFSKTVVIYWL